MGRRKNSGKHVTPRTPVQFPNDWLATVRKLAAQRKQPVLWYLLSIIADDAKAQGTPHPRLPWEDELLDPEPKK